MVKKTNKKLIKKSINNCPKDKMNPPCVKTQGGTASEGNINPSLAANDEGKFRCRKFFITWFFDLDTEYTRVLEWCKSRKSLKYILGDEICPSTGRRHLQGYMEFNNPIWDNTLRKLMPKVWLRRAYGSIESNFHYNTKDNKFETNIYIEKPTIITKLKDWQNKILENLNTIPDDRTINWVYDKIGNSGKTVFCKYLHYHKKAFVIKSGKANDAKYILKEEKVCRDIVFDLSRSNEEFVSYTCIEEIKDGHFFSGKYESKSMLISTPHIYIFCNFLPNINKLSKDRWKIWNLSNDTLSDITNKIINNEFEDFEEINY